ncbi:hypothetical protein KQI65_12200 [bacterium]|nr:hypothetical protein [bacterium]
MKIPMTLLSLLLTVVLISSMPGCDDEGTRPGDEIVFPESNVSYSQHVQPFFNLRCANIGCHDASTRAGSLSLASYSETTENPAIVRPGNANGSLLMQRIDGRLPHPIDVPIIINDNQLEGIRTWINEGAKYN